jgi:DNA-binding NarL/FixJ family response regulator
LGLLAVGRSNREIAAALVLSPKTVGHHIESIYAKAAVSTRTGTTMFAMQHGLVPSGIG